MEELIRGFADQLTLAIQIGVNSSFKENRTEVRNVVISGMGGSGIGGNVVSQLCKETLAVPIEVVKGYSIPAYVNKNTLFIASSYSGDTEETCECLKEAIKKQAIVCVVTSGGKILEISKEIDSQRIIIPGGTNCPRANLGLSFVSLLFVLNKYDLISNDFIEQVQNGISLIESDKDVIISKSKQIARKLKSKLPIVYSDDVFYPVALRFQQQINENSKEIAHINVFPEMNHNEIVGWSASKKMFSNRCLIYVENRFAHKSIVDRMRICEDIFKENCDEIIKIEAKGGSLLEEYIYLFHLVDWISYFLALENNVDPFPVEKIDYLKSKLMTLN
jgi:glucose/mannose-6-phosphate isomerase